MRVLLTTLGTRGDVQPFVTLARGLADAGHEAVVASSAGLGGLAEAQGVPFRPLRLDFTELQDTASGRAVMRGDVSAIAGALRRVRPRFRESLADQARVVAEERPDVLLAHPKTLGGPHLAEWRGIPYANALVVPGFTATGAFPPIPATWTRTPGWLNRAAYRMIPAGMAAFRGIVKDWRRGELGLPGSAPLWDGGGRTLYGYSPAVVPNPSDWPPAARAVGFWLPGPPADFAPDPALAAFLAVGPPPVFVGFGSMVSDDPGRLGALVAEAVRRAGVRAVVQSRPGLLEAGSTDRIHVVGPVPHGWLFPRVSCVVHHGGSGTTGAAIMSGNPQVVVPFAVDQPFWAGRMHALGVAPAPILRRRLDPGRLTRAIRDALDAEPMRRAAARLGAAVRAEDGVAAGVRYVEDLHRASRRPA